MGSGPVACGSSQVVAWRVKFFGYFSRNARSFVSTASELS